MNDFLTRIKAKLILPNKLTEGKMIEKKDDPDWEPGVRLSGPNNSTMFTECCGTAICNDQGDCPQCGRKVYGHWADTAHERGLMRWRYAYRG